MDKNKMKKLMEMLRKNAGEFTPAMYEGDGEVEKTETDMDIKIPKQKARPLSDEMEAKKKALLMLKRK
jgi:hypothetical protein